MTPASPNPQAWCPLRGNSPLCVGAEEQVRGAASFPPRRLLGTISVGRYIPGVCVPPNEAVIGCYLYSTLSALSTDLGALKAAQRGWF